MESPVGDSHHVMQLRPDQAAGPLLPFCAVMQELERLLTAIDDALSQVSKTQ
jgi:hypothetical protein